MQLHEKMKLMSSEKVNIILNHILMKLINSVCEY